MYTCLSERTGPNRLVPKSSPSGRIGGTAPAHRITGRCMPAVTFFLPGTAERLYTKGSMENRRDTMRRFVVPLIVLSMICSSLLAAVPVAGEDTRSDGVTFSSDYPVSGTDDIGNDPCPRVSVGGGKIHAVWIDSNDVYYKSSADDGVTWSTEVLVGSGSFSSSRWIDVANSGGDVYVVWSDSKIQVRKYSGSSFVDVSPDPAITGVFTPSIAVSGSNVVVAWRDNTNEIKAALSSNGATSWGAPVLASNPALTASTQYTDCAISGSNVAVIYQALRSINQGLTTDDEGIFCAGGSLGGSLSFSGDREIDDDPSGESDQQYPTIAAASGGFYVAWTDHRNNPSKRIGGGRSDIYVQKLSASGTASGDPVMVNDNEVGKGMGRARLAPDMSNPNKVFVVWEDNRDSRTSVYCSQSSDGGGSWSQNMKVHVRSPVRIRNSPDAHADGGLLYVVWKDGEENNVKFTMSELVNSPPPKPSIKNYDPKYNFLTIEWNDISTTVKDFQKYQLFMDTTSGFTPGDSNLVWEGYGGSVDLADEPLPPWNFTLMKNTVYYAKLKIVDELGASAISDEVTIKIPDHNYPPVFLPEVKDDPPGFIPSDVDINVSEIEDIVLDEDSSVERDLSTYFWDDGYKGTDLRYGFAPDYSGDVPIFPGLNARMDGSKLLIDPIPEWNGQVTVGVRVYDAGLDQVPETDDDEYADSNNFIIKVNGINDPAYIKSIYSSSEGYNFGPDELISVQTEENSNARFQISVVEPDNDRIEAKLKKETMADYEVDFIYNETTFYNSDTDKDESGTIITCDMTVGKTGGIQALFQIIVTEENTTTGEENELVLDCKLLVNEYNDPPSILFVGDTLMVQDENEVNIPVEEKEGISVQIEGEDPEGEELSYLIEGLLEDMKARLFIDETSGMLTFTPNQDDVDHKTVSVKVKAFDGTKYSSSVTIIFQVSDYNEPPADPTWEVFVGKSEPVSGDSISTYTATEITVKPTSIDPDGDRVTISINWGDTNTEETDSDISKTHRYTNEGTFKIKVTATDDKGKESETMSLTVFVFSDQTDSDGDGYPDAIEQHHGTDPDDANSHPNPSDVGFDPTINKPPEEDVDEESSGEAFMKYIAPIIVVVVVVLVVGMMFLTFRKKKKALDEQREEEEKALAEREANMVTGKDLYGVQTTGVSVFEQRKGAQGQARPPGGGPRSIDDEFERLYQQAGPQQGGGGGAPTYQQPGAAPQQQKVYRQPGIK